MKVPMPVMVPVAGNDGKLHDFLTNHTRQRQMRRLGRQRHDKTNSVEIAIALKGSQGYE
jgi:hypothetical protein